jgi:hypothetical protein
MRMGLARPFVDPATMSLWIGMDCTDCTGGLMGDLIQRSEILFGLRVSSLHGHVIPPVGEAVIPRRSPSVLIHPPELITSRRRPVPRGFYKPFQRLFQVLWNPSPIEVCQPEIEFPRD